ncbi:hypothetical protein FHP25_24805 [Vineibacter terrae]|uniref:Uncharacterized protein n=1 Tax=Vineibacter terrae TaxID=2586908 RepID=A0A5C8PHE7_9HYPH|nr:hypothetical protein FHP25_24805 [Vineibacter terrae]
MQQACEATGVAVALEPGVAEIAAERRRQREVEGWTEAHDDEHARGEMAQAAACYAISAPIYDVRGAIPSRFGVPQPALKWPWGPEWWKPRSQLRNLERAGALIAAEIARIKRRRQTPIPPARPEAE